MSSSEAERAREAFEAVGHDLLAYFERRVEPRDDAADLVAETFLTAWRRVGDLPSGYEAQRRWLFGVAAHHLANHRRGRRRRLGLADRVRAHLRSDVSPGVTEALVVRDAVQRLREPQREIIRLVHWEGFTVAEAAEILGLNASTARSRYATARASLRTSLLTEPDEVVCPR